MASLSDTCERLTKRARSEEEPRRKQLHDSSTVSKLGGLSETAAVGVFQEEYRIVESSEICDSLPDCVYKKKVCSGKITIRTSWKDIPKFGNILLLHFPDVIKKYPQLGNFFLLDGKGRLAGGAIHQMFARLCKGSTEYNKLFLVNGMVVRFSPVELSMITGMRFYDERTAEDIAKPKNLKELAFPDHHSNDGYVTHKDLLDKIEEYESDEHRPLTEYPIIVNLCFVWLVSNVISTDRSEFIEEDEIFELCSDLDVCEKYPWGLKVWQSVGIDSFEQMGDINLSTNNTKDRYWNSYGFIFVVEFWMIEALEDAQSKLAKYVRTEYASSYPRMLRWSLKENPQGNNKFSDFLNNVKNVYPRLKPDILEFQSEYFYKTLCYLQQEEFSGPDCLRFGPDNRVFSDYVQFHSDSMRTEDAQTNADGSLPPQMSYQAGPSSNQAGPSFPSGGPEDWLASLQQTIQKNHDAVMAREEETYRLQVEMNKRQEEMQRSQLEIQKTLIEKQSVQIRDLGVQIDGLGRRIQSVEELLRDFSLGNRRDEFPPMEFHPTPMTVEYPTTPQSMVIEHSTHVQPRVDAAFNMESLISGKAGTSGIKNVRDRRPSHYTKSPFHAISIGRRQTYNAQSREFDEYLNMDKPCIGRDLGMGSAIYPDFFREMISLKVDMDIYQVNVVLELLHHDFKFIGEEPHPSMKDQYTIVPCTFFQTLNYIWDKGNHHTDSIEPVPLEDLQKCLEMMANGVETWKPKPWSSIRYVLTIANVDGHYIALCIDLNEEKINIYDSFRHKYTDEIAMLRFKALVPLIYWLHHMVNKVGLPTNKKVWDFEFKHQRSCYTQTDNNNCGAFALGQIIAIITNKMSRSHLESDMGNFRYVLAKSVFQYSTIWTE